MGGVKRCAWCRIKNGDRWGNVLERVWDKKGIENKPKVKAKFLKKLGLRSKISSLT